MMNIVLADLQNSYFGLTRNSVPINIGYVAEYLDANLAGGRQITLTRQIDEFFRIIANDPPHIVGFGFYSWNHGLVFKTAEQLKKRHPECVVVLGGPSVNEDREIAKDIFMECGAIDYLIPNEGEQPFLRLVSAYAASPSDVRNVEQEIQGCFGRSRITGRIHGSSQDRFEGDINSIPSPYLSGRMDKFLDIENYLPIVQTARGCPYGCTFCVSGKRSWNKIRTFSLDRIRDEFAYIQKRSASTYLRLADENFGVLPRDTEVASLVREMKDRTGFPDAISIYTDKHPSDRVLAINKLLSDILPFNISFQSMTAEVLNNIKRININDERIQTALRFAEENDLMLVSELIFGLPGETVDSFLASIDKLVRLRFESVILIQLYILKGSEMDVPAHRKTYGVKTRYMISENGYTDSQDIRNVEVDEWVTETSTIPEIEYLDFNRSIFVFDFIHAYGFGRELLFLFESLGVSPSALIQALVAAGSPAVRLMKRATAYRDTVGSLLKPTKQEAIDSALAAILQDGEQKLTGVLETKRDMMIDILKSQELGRVLAEISDVGMSMVAPSVWPQARKDRLGDLVRETARFCYSRSIDIGADLDDRSFSSRYDFAGWVKSKFVGLPELLERDQVLRLVIQSRPTLEKIQETAEGERAAYRRFFSVTNSKTNRRKIELAVNYATHPSGT